VEYYRKVKSSLFVVIYFYVEALFQW
jgi:hypothetical protein